MRSGSFDSWLVFDDPNGPMRESDDDGAGGRDAQITVTLPHDGNYLIVANSVVRASGAYTLSVQSERAGFQEQGPPGGAGGTLADLTRMQLPRITAGQSVNGRLAGGDFLRSDDDSYADGYAYEGPGGRGLTITCAPAASTRGWCSTTRTAPCARPTTTAGAATTPRSRSPLPHAGRYVIIANSVGPTGGGRVHAHRLRRRRRPDSGSSRQAKLRATHVLSRAGS